VLIIIQFLLLYYIKVIIFSRSSDKLPTVIGLSSFGKTLSK